MFNQVALVKYIKNTSWLLVERFFYFTIQFVVLFFLARQLGPERYGTLNFVLSVAGIFTVFASFGLERIVVRALVQEPQRHGEIMGTAVSLRLLTACLAILVIFTATYFLPNENNERTYILIISIGFLFQAMFVVDSYFQAETKAKYGAISRSAMVFLSGAAKLIGVYLNADLIWFVVVFFLDSVVLAFFYVLIYRHLRTSRFWRFDFNLAKGFFLECWPIILMGVMTAIAIKTDQIMLNYMLGPAAVGQYAAAVRMTELWYFIPTVIVSSLFAAVVRAKEVGEKEFTVRVQRLYDLVFFIAVALAIVVSISSDWIINLVFGGAFDQSASVLKIYIWITVFVFLGMVRHMWILAQHFQRDELILESSTVFFNIVLNLVLIPRFGITGAAFATLGSFFISYCLMPFWLENLRPVPRMFATTVLHFLQLRLFRDKWLGSSE